MNRIEQDAFWNAYDRLAEDGRCDSAGGMEYKRVRREWEAAGRPPDLAHFIVVHANVGPTGHGREQMN